MAFDTTILSNKIEGLKEAYRNGRFADALVGALNTGNGLMQQRIFTNNQDVLGNSLGTYKKGSVKDAIVKKNKAGKLTDVKFTYNLSSYQKKRAKYGRQVARKDLEFFGSLRRAIETQIESERAAILEFNNTDAAKIAKGQENQISNIRNGKKGTTKNQGGAIKIFGLNKFEKEQVNEQGLELIKQILKSK